MSKAYLLGFGVLVLFAAGILAFAYRYVDRARGTICTMEAKICPDGSAVGRTGPDCAFAPCPAASSPSTASTTVTVRIDQSATALDVTVIPRMLLEDSRCPADVQCIQAGTVRVRALIRSGLGDGMMVFELGKPITTEAEMVTLIFVSPEPRSTRTLVPGDYRFTFEIAKRAAAR